MVGFSKSAVVAGLAVVGGLGSLPAAVRADIVSENEDKIMLGGEFEFAASKSTGGWSKVPLAVITCTRPDKDDVKFELQSEDDTDMGYKLEFVTGPCPVNDRSCLQTQLNGIREMFNSMKSTGLVDNLDVGDNCKSVINPARQDVARGLKVKSDAMGPKSSQASFGLPILYYHPAIQHLMEADGSMEDFGKALNRFQGFDPDPTHALTAQTTTSDSVGGFLRKSLCHDYSLYKSRKSKGSRMSKDDHHVLPKINWVKSSEWTRKKRDSTSKNLFPRHLDKYEFPDDVCKYLGAGFTDEQCKFISGSHPTGFSGNNFDCFKIKNDDVDSKAWSRVGFVAESRATNKLGHFKACMSGFLLGGAGAPTQAKVRAFETCYNAFRDGIQAVWAKAAEVTGNTH